MAYVTNTGGSAKEVLIREQLEDWVSIMDPTDAPLHSVLTPHPVQTRVVEYGVDNFGINYTALPSTEAKAEGAAAVDPVAGEIYPTRLRSVMQINSESATVSGTDRASLHAGIEEPYEYRAYKSLTRVVQQAEKAMLFGLGSTANPAAGSPGGTRQTQGLLSWAANTGLQRFAADFSSITSITDDTGNVIPKDYFSTFFNAQGTNLDRSILTHSILGTAVGNGFIADGAVGMASYKIKGLFTEMGLTANGAINERKIDAQDRMFIDVVDAYQTVAGTVYINWNRWFDRQQATTINPVVTGGSGGAGSVSVPWYESLVFMMPKYIRRGVFRGAYMRPLAADGDRDQFMVITEGGLIVLNPIALCGGTNLLAP
jgi:hypothetical protein